MSVLRGELQPIAYFLVTRAGYLGAYQRTVTCLFVLDIDSWLWKNRVTTPRVLELNMLGSQEPRGGCN